MQLLVQNPLDAERFSYQSVSPLMVFAQTENPSEMKYGDVQFLDKVGAQSLQLLHLHVSSVVVSWVGHASGRYCERGRCLRATVPWKRT